MPKTMIEIRQLADNNGGTSIAPITIPEAVVYENGDNLNDKIGDIDISSINDGTLTEAINELNNFCVKIPNYGSKVSMGLPANPISTTTNTFTCPADGWIAIVADRGSTSGYTLRLWINGNDVTFFPAHFAYYVGQVYLPVKEGDIIKLVTDATSTTWTVRQQDFYYSY